MADASGFFQRTAWLATDPRSYAEANFIKDPSNGIIDACIFMCTAGYLLIFAEFNPDLPSSAHFEQKEIMLKFVGFSLAASSISGFILYKLYKNKIRFRECWSLVITNASLAQFQSVANIYLFRIPFMIRLLLMFVPIFYTGPLMIMGVTEDTYKQALGKMLLMTLIYAGFIGFPLNWFMLYS